jgi:hypothetical protein
VSPPDELLCLLRDLASYGTWAWGNTLADRYEQATNALRASVWPPGAEKRWQDAHAALNEAQEQVNRLWALARKHYPTLAVSLGPLPGFVTRPDPAHYAELVDLLRGAVGGAPDLSDYCPATKIVKQKRGGFHTLKQVKRALEKHPEIRRHKPSPKRLYVHLGDWQTFLDRRDRDTSEALDDRRVSAFVTETQACLAEIRQQKQAKKQARG